MVVNGAFVTLLTKDEYLPGALVVDLCFKEVGSSYPFVVLVTNTLSQDSRKILLNRGIRVRDVEQLLPLSNKHTLAVHDARFADTWTKLRCGLHILSQKISYSVSELSDSLSMRFVASISLRPIPRLTILL